MSTSQHRHRVVVIGAGFGGLRVARGLRDAPVDLTIVDANNFHTFQPLLYQVATAGLDTDDIAYPVRGIFRRQRNVTVRMATVTAIDLAARRVQTDRGTPLEYDALVVAAGSISHDFGIPGVAEHTHPLKTAGDAVALRNHLLARFEDAALSGDTAEVPMCRDGELDVVVCGGGPTGLAELYQRVLAKDFPRLDVAGARITLVEAAPRVLGTFHPSLGEQASKTLTERGIEVITGVPVERVEPGAVHLASGRVLTAQTVVWAAGVRANPLAELLGVELGRGGRVVVQPDLSVPGHPEVFAIGDIAVDPASPLPQVAQPAIQGGKHVAVQIVRRLDGQKTQPFRYHDKGSMATIGRHHAVAEFPNGMRLHGVVGWLAWLALHIVYLMGFRNRANVLVNWAWNYVTYDRASRLLAEPGPLRDRTM
jgi:NADH:ubiquinone reductase (H+-translocating)